MELRPTPKSHKNSGRVISPSIISLRRSGLLCERGGQKQGQKDRQQDPLHFFSSSVSTKTGSEKGHANEAWVNSPPATTKREQHNGWDRAAPSDCASLLRGRDLAFCRAETSLHVPVRSPRYGSFRLWSDGRFLSVSRCGVEGGKKSPACRGCSIERPFFCESMTSRAVKEGVNELESSRFIPLLAEE